MKSKGGFKSRGRRPHGGGGGGMHGAKHRTGGGPHRPHQRRGPGRGPSRPTTTACPMCGAVVSDLAGHVRSKHDDPEAHPRD